MINFYEKFGQNSIEFITKQSSFYYLNARMNQTYFNNQQQMKKQMPYLLSTYYQAIYFLLSLHPLPDLIGKLWRINKFIPHKKGNWNEQRYNSDQLQCYDGIEIEVEQTGELISFRYDLSIHGLPHIHIVVSDQNYIAICRAVIYWEQIPDQTLIQRMNSRLSRQLRMKFNKKTLNNLVFNLFNNGEGRELCLGERVSFQKLFNVEPNIQYDFIRQEANVDQTKLNRLNQDCLKLLKTIISHQDNQLIKQLYSALAPLCQLKNINEIPEKVKQSFNQIIEARVNFFQKVGSDERKYLSEMIEEIQRRSNQKKLEEVLDNHQEKTYSIILLMIKDYQKAKKKFLNGLNKNLEDIAINKQVMVLCHSCAIEEKQYEQQIDHKLNHLKQAINESINEKSVQLRNHLQELKDISNGLVADQPNIENIITNRKKFAAKLREFAQQIKNTIQSYQIMNKTSNRIYFISYLATFVGGLALSLFSFEAAATPIALGGLVSAAGAAATSIIISAVKSLELTSIKKQIDRKREQINQKDIFMTNSITDFCKIIVSSYDIIRIYRKGEFFNSLLEEGGLKQITSIVDELFHKLLEHKLDGQKIVRAPVDSHCSISTQLQTKTEERLLRLKKQIDDNFSPTEFSLEMAAAAEKIAQTIDSSTEEYENVLRTMLNAVTKLQVD